MLTIIKKFIYSLILITLTKSDYSLNYYRVNKVKKSDIYIIEEVINLSKAKILRYYSVSTYRLGYNTPGFINNSIT